MKTFRNKHPQRTYTGTAKEKYTEYHSELREDFNHRCAYTDCSDSWWQDGFHIDHFAPKEPRSVKDAVKKAKFKALENSYSNLVYACPQVNRSKQDDWPSDDPAISQVGDKGYIDPCTDFNEYFERTNEGAIVPKDNQIAKYMWKRLKLYLIRYELYWRMEQLAARSTRLASLSKTANLPDEIKSEAQGLMADLIEEHAKYERYLDANYRGIIRDA
jgi:hypothetical protein